MPVIPNEIPPVESAKDKVQEGTEQTKATAQDHKSKGPVIPDKDLPEPASREELKARMEELNKK